MTIKNKSMKELQKETYLSGDNDAYLEELYETYLKNPDDVATEWKKYFDQMPGSNNDVLHSEIREYFQDISQHSMRNVFSQDVDLHHVRQQEKVIDLINAYRRLGHLQANIDPLGLYQGSNNPTLDLSYYGFTDADMDTVFDVGTFKGLQKSTASLREIIEGLRKVYCNTIGVEYMYINRLEEVSWLQERMEQHWPQNQLTKEEKLRILDRLIVADGLEKYLGFKYVGQKRFSLEGGDSLIPMMDAIVHHGAALGIKEVVIGMAHRGRLNVLVNVLGKESGKIFAGFEGKNIDESSSGDVKYHLGFSSDVKTAYGPIHLSLAFNPSHLEIVSPVVQGSVRCRQRRRRDAEYDLVMPVQIHGDAAFAGQGVVMETFNMSQARWFAVGGSIHIVINNQVGFTTSNPLDARSGLYCTDISKMVEAPIFHVNANDSEAVLFVSKIAAEYRNKFKRDIVIDLVCYRRHGHNEADEPSATQPVMYKVIKAMQPTCNLYAKKLLAEGVITETTEKEIADKYRTLLDEGKSVVETVGGLTVYEYAQKWEPYLNQVWDQNVETSLPLDKLKSLAKNLEMLPEGFTLQPQVKKMYETRQKMTKGETPINWGYAETLAYATLLDEGYPIRLCGQDAGRGTFAHRHAVLYDQTSGQVYIPLSHIGANQSQINIIDSLLSEEAVLAFEYGFASTEPNNFVIWEAQFGDFANGAQVVFDQFLSSGEQKWGRLCGLVVLLPHGYEGQGPEHSSARLERYLQLCAQQNMQVCVPTTSAQVYHMLRRQMIRPFRKPLIVMTPKSLLRNPAAVSTLDELANGKFQVVIPEIDKMTASKVDRLIFCSGKVYYDLVDKRRENKLENVAIVRVEQLYPFAETEIKKELAKYKNANDIIWCQEEPENQGSWFFIQRKLSDCLGKNQILRYVGRPASASPAVGYTVVHLKEQEKLVDEALVK